MNLSGSCLNSKVSSLLPYNRNPYTLRTSSRISSIQHAHKRIESFNYRSSRGPLPEIKSSASLGIQHFCLSAASSPFLHGEQGSLFHTIPKFPRMHRQSLAPRASKDVPFSYRYPAMKKKSRWWWRTLAYLPCLMPLHETWMYAETTYHLHPFLEDFEFLTYPFLEALGILSSWFLMAYFCVAYLGVVRRKEWPPISLDSMWLWACCWRLPCRLFELSRWMPLVV